MKIILILIFFYLVVNEKIKHDLLQNFRFNNTKSIMIVMKEFKIYESSFLLNKMDHSEKGFYIMNYLKKQSKQSQSSIIKILKQTKAKYKILWICNSIIVYSGLS
jgi:hypothetical protein